MKRKNVITGFLVLCFALIPVLLLVPVQNALALGAGTGVFTGGFATLPSITEIRLKAAPGADFPDEVIVQIPEVQAQVRFPNNTACFAGLCLRDLFPELTSKWYTGVEIDTSSDALHIFPLVASNHYIIGQGYVVVLGGSILVNFVINGTPEAEILDSIANGGAIEPSQGSDGMTEQVAVDWLSVYRDWSSMQVGLEQFVLQRLLLEVGSIPASEISGLAASELMQLFDTCLADYLASPEYQLLLSIQTNTGTINNQALSQEGNGAVFTSGDARNSFIFALANLYAGGPNFGDSGSPARTDFEIAFQFLRLMSLSAKGASAGDDGEPLMSGAQSGNIHGVTLQGGFVALYPNPNHLVPEDIEAIETALANMRRNVPTALPANCYPWGEFIEIASIVGGSSTIWVTPLELLTYQTNSSAIGGTWNGTDMIMTRVPLQ